MLGTCRIKVDVHLILTLQRLDQPLDELLRDASRSHNISIEMSFVLEGAAEAL